MSTPRLQQLFDFLKKSPGEPFLLFAIAKEYERISDLENAKSYYLQLEQNHADYVGTYYHLGKLYESEDKLDFAISTYEKGMEVAKAAGDKHAFGELRGAKEMIEF